MVRISAVSHMLSPYHNHCDMRVMEAYGLS